MPKPPESYLDEKRPPLAEALQLEGQTGLDEGLEILKSKGYFTPPPRPWGLGVDDRGNGRRSYAVLDKFGDVVVVPRNRETAELIISAVNEYKPAAK